MYKETASILVAEKLHWEGKIIWVSNALTFFRSVLKSPQINIDLFADRTTVSTKHKMLQIYDKRNHFSSSLAYTYTSKQKNQNQLKYIHQVIQKEHKKTFYSLQLLGRQTADHMLVWRAGKRTCGHARALAVRHYKHLEGVQWCTQFTIYY